MASCMKVYIGVILWCFTDGIYSSYMKGKGNTAVEKKYVFDMMRGSEPLEKMNDKSHPSFEDRPPRPNFFRSMTSSPLGRDSDGDGESLSSSDYEEPTYHSNEKTFEDAYTSRSQEIDLTSTERVENAIKGEVRAQNAKRLSESIEIPFAKSPHPDSDGESEVKGERLARDNVSKKNAYNQSDTNGDQGQEGESSGEIGDERNLGEQQEKLLLFKLMDGYEKDVRPVRNASLPVVIRVGITLTQIFDMDEKNQVLTTNVWLDQEWNDELLKWNPDDFGGLEMIRLPCSRIWLPDIVLYNNADDYTRGYMPSRAMVSYDGNVFWPPPTKFRSTCSVDVTYFPFDDQVCFLKLGSWTYNGFQVDITNRTSAVDLSNYISNGEWELIKAVQQRNVVYYSCCPEPFPDVTITLVIRRKTLYYIYNIVLPCIMLSALTLLVFCLPPDSGEKIALGITVLLAFSVFMLAINESLPETSESIPLIGVYLTIVMAITSVSVIMTVVVLNLHYLGPQVRPVPSWLLCLLPKWDGSHQIRQKSLLVPVTQREPKSGSLKRNHIFITKWRGDNGEKYSIDVPEGKGEEPMRETSEASSAESITNGNGSNFNSSNIVKRVRPTTICESSSSHVNHPRRHSGQSLDKDGSGGCITGAGTVFEELLVSIKKLISKQDEIEAQNNLVAEWRLVAQVVDRILFWIFFTFTMSSSTMILLILPIYKRSWYGSPLLIINDTDLGPY